jgi:phosphoribosyl-ATP pyrophosphohydrolase
MKINLILHHYYQVACLSVLHEAADTIYHILVVLEAADIKFEDVLKELEDRKKQSGIEEKNSR